MRDFFEWLDARRAETTLEEIEPFMVAAFIKQLPSSPRNKQQYISALRMLFSFLVEKGVLSTDNPALDVKPPRFSSREGATLALSPTQVRTLLDSIDTGTIVAFGTEHSLDSCSTGRQGTPSITRFLETRGSLEEAANLANHADMRTTRLDDKRDRIIRRMSVERIVY